VEEGRAGVVLLGELGVVDARDAVKDVGMRAETGLSAEGGS
jgi:hypothetical protein